MQPSSQKLLLHGALAGLLAAVVVALWFLALDLAAGEPLRTPALLGSVFLDAPEAAGPTRMAVLYTILHFGAFLALGIGTAAALRALGLEPSWLLGLLFGLGVANAAHYGALLLVDGRVLAVLPWEHVMGANLLAGLAVMAYLNRFWPMPRRIGPAALWRHPLLLRGLVVGLVGAGAVALWFFLLDIAAGEPFRTPAALGSALFLGARSPEEVPVSAGIVAAYTAVHLLAFWIVGSILAAVARQVERTPRSIYVVILALVIVEAVSFAVLVAGAQWVLGALSVAAVGAGNLVAVAAMAGWLWWARPQLRRGVREEGGRSAA